MPCILHAMCMPCICMPYLCNVFCTSCLCHGFAYLISPFSCMPCLLKANYTISAHRCMENRFVGLHCHSSRLTHRVLPITHLASFVHWLLITHCSLFVAYHALLIVCCLSCIAHCLLLIMHCSLFVAYHALLITCCYLLLSCIAHHLSCCVHCLLYSAYHAALIIHCSSFIARCLLLIQHCSLFAAYRQLLTILLLSICYLLWFILTFNRHYICTTPSKHLLDNIDQTFKMQFRFSSKVWGKLGTVGQLDMKIKPLIAISMQHH